MTLIPDRGGCFEITMDGELVYSKLATDEFPNENAIMEIAANRLKVKKA
jgi:selenoprotein W-related protein